MDTDMDVNVDIDMNVDMDMNVDIDMNVDMDMNIEMDMDWTLSGIEMATDADMDVLERKIGTRLSATGLVQYFHIQKCDIVLSPISE
jgi:hypothetical protein